MKNAIIAFLIAITFSVNGQQTEGQSFVQYYTQPDKMLHMGAGYGISSTATTWYALSHPNEPLINAFGTGLMVGWGVGGLKELSDWKLGTGTPDAGDMYATIFGSALGSLVTIGVIRWSRKRYAKKQRRIGRDFVSGDKVVLR